MNQLPIFMNLKGRKVILLGDGAMAAAKRRLYERAGAIITGEETADAALAVVAMENTDLALAAAARLKHRGFLVNVVDQPEHCDFTTPAIIDRDPVIIAIGTDGSSAGLAKALRQRLEYILPETLGALATALFAGRPKIKALWSDKADRRRAIDMALDDGAMLDPLSDGSADQFPDWLENPDAEKVSRTVSIDLTSDDPDDLTIKQARVLGRADRLYVGKNVSEKTLVRARADAERFALEEFDSENVAGLNVLIKMV